MASFPGSLGSPLSGVDSRMDAPSLCDRSHHIPKGCHHSLWVQSPRGTVLGNILGSLGLARDRRLEYKWEGQPIAAVSPPQRAKVLRFEGRQLVYAGPEIVGSRKGVRGKLSIKVKE